MFLAEEEQSLDKEPIMKTHARHVFIAAVVLAILLLIAAVAARSANFSFI